MGLIMGIWRRIRGGTKPAVVQMDRSRSTSSNNRRMPGRRSMNGTAVDLKSEREDSAPSCLGRGVEKAPPLPFPRDSLEMASVTRSDTGAVRETRLTTSTVLVVDDEESIRDLVRAMLTREGRQVFLAAQGQEAIEVFCRERPDITILDLQMPKMNGMEVLRQIRAIDPQAIVMVFTGADTEASVREARELGVTEFLHKGASLPAVWEARSRPL